MTQPLTANEIRATFLQFFQSKQHQIVPSAPMVVKGDPTLMFNNSGMAPFKDIFLGNSPVKYPRITDTQKCLRVSGKHNDLEEVGVDTYHHTMFEMLGNWSFGDYFKTDAITWAWELLTDVYKIDKDRLYVTVFEGSEADGVPFDQEAYDTWKKFVAEDRILMGNKKDNFWEMGDMGPCGPCTEIHYDGRTPEQRVAVSGASRVNNDDPQVIEIWNNVFMEFNRKADGSLEKLPAQHVDTGMGFERLVRVLQNKQSNYDSDVFLPLIHAIETLTTNLTYETFNPNVTDAQERTNVAMRVIADHIRTVSFSIADGQLPSNTGAGYVIRRILRRAIRYGYQSLQIREPFMYKLVKTLAGQMGGAFPELSTQQQLIEKVIKETAFGIRPRNAEQAFALHAILNTDVKLVTIQGAAGTGKTLLALAGALVQRADFSQIYLARPIVPLSNKDIGFLPGDIKSKINPYMEPLWDNLKFIQSQYKETDKDYQKITEMVEKEKLFITPLAYIRGRSLSNIIFIIDEAQNLTPHEVKTIITRAGENTKIIFTGDIYQIDTPYLDSHGNGLSTLIEKVKGSKMYAHVSLEKGERSELANLASSML